MSQSIWYEMVAKAILTELGILSIVGSNMFVFSSLDTIYHDFRCPGAEHDFVRFFMDISRQPLIQSVRVLGPPEKGRFPITNPVMGVGGGGRVYCKFQEKSGPKAL